MKAIIFSSRKNVLQTEFEIELIKYGFLLSNTVCIAGQLAASLLFEKESPKFSILKKIKLLRDTLRYVSDDTENKETNLKSLNEFIDRTNTYHTLKHPTTLQSTIYNTSKIAYLNWYNDYLKEIYAYQITNGMTNIAALWDEKKIELKLTNISLGEYTYAKHEPEMNAKQILELLFSSNKSNEPSILLLPYQFPVIKKQLILLQWLMKLKMKKVMNLKNMKTGLIMY